jgi:flagellar protein FliO/FliZ
VTPFLIAQAAVPGPDLAPSLGRMFLALAVVLALVAALAWALRRGWVARRPGNGIGVESALALGERRSLVIVSVEGRRLLVGLAPNHVSLVTELHGPSFEQAIVTSTAQQEAQ